MSSLIKNRNDVVGTAEIKSAYTPVAALFTSFWLEMSLDEALYNLYLKLKDSPEFTTYDESQKTVIDNALIDFKSKGIDLPAEKKMQLTVLKADLKKLVHHRNLWVTCS